jgi:RNA polymerase primary sigma factor
MISKLYKARCRLSQEYGRNPTTEELAAYMEISTEKVDRLFGSAFLEPISLDMPVGDDREGAKLGDFVEDQTTPSPEDQVIKTLLKKQVRDALALLRPQERQVMELRFGINDDRDRTLEEVGQHFGFTRERARQIEARALKELRGQSCFHKLKDYIEWLEE